LPLEVVPGHSTHDAQIFIETVDPVSVPWMQLLTGRRDPGLVQPANTPVVGIMPPSAARGDETPPTIAELDAQAVQQLTADRYKFQRSADPLQVTLLAAPLHLAGNEAHVVRIRQQHDGEIVGGYTVIMMG
jgi:hypothetical protein